MAKLKFKPARLLKQAFFFFVGALITGLGAVFMDRFLQHFIPRNFAAAFGVGIAIFVSLTVLKFFKHPPFWMKRSPPILLGFCAGLGVYVARTWLR